MERARYLDCDGKPFTSEQANRVFVTVVANIYERCNKTVEQILKGWLTVFSVEVRNEVCRTTLKFESRDYENLTEWTLQGVKYVANGFDFTDHVAKRLVLLRKAGKLARKNPIRLSNKGKKKKRKPGVTAGSKLKGVK